MGGIEDRVKKQIRVGKTERAILGIVYGAGVVSMAIVAPNALRLLKKVKFPKQNKNYVKQATRRLEEKGLVKFEKTDKGIFVRATPKGELFLMQTIENSEKVLRQKKWDGKWRLVIFDIPEKKKSLRNKVREIVEGLGFKKLQNSVWVFPYPTEELVVLLKSELKIGKDVLYIVADEIEYDQPLRQHFGLETTR